MSLSKIWSKDKATAMKNSEVQSRMPWAADVRPGRILFLVAVPFFVVAYFSFLARNYQMDDALIYLRYVRNFHDGFGLVYNPGEKFNGLTSPLFTYVSLAASFLSGNFQLITTIISALFLTCASILGGIIFSSGRWETLFTAVVIGSFGYFYGTYGMETPLFLMLIGLSLYLYKVDSKYFVLALAFLSITRFEGALLAVVMAADYLIRNRKLPETKILAFSLLVLLLPLIFNYFYYGEFLPATASAKLGQGSSGFWSGPLRFLNIAYLIKMYFSNNNMAAFFFLAASVYGMVVSMKDRVAVVAMVFFALLLCFYVGFNLPNYQWYYAPFFYLMLIFACRGIWWASTCLISGRKPDYRAAAFILLCAVTIFSLTKVVSFKEGGRNEAYARIGGWIKANTPANSTIAMVEIGTVGWYADRRIIDILGLVNKYNANYIAKGDLYGWLYRYQPDYILRHDPIWTYEKSTSILEQSGAYASMQEFNFSGYALLRKTDKYSDEEIGKYFREVSLAQSAIHPL
jgi:arabinofuranosyltransferase